MMAQRALMVHKAATPPNRSLDFEASSSQRLSMSGTDFGSLHTKKWTYHVWFKRESTGNQTFVYKANGGATLNPIHFFFSSSNPIDVRVRNGFNTIIGRLLTTATFTDTNWHQMVVYWDTAHATAADRFQLYIDQSRITSFTVETQPALNADMGDSTDAAMYIGSLGGASGFYDGLLYQQAFFSNALPDISLLHSGSSPVDLRGMSGLFSLLHTNDVDDLEDDYVLATNWTNNNTVIKSTTIPT